MSGTNGPKLYESLSYTVVVRLQGDQDMVDLAILEVSGVAVEVPPLRYGAVDRSAPAVVERCWAIGFPRFKERARNPKPLRLSAQVDGEIPTGENLDQQLLTLRVRNSPRPLPSGAVHESEWAGMSGATVFSGENVIVGVITEHHLPEGESALTVVPITALDLLADVTEWWKLLGVDHQRFVRLPDRDPSSIDAALLNDDELFVLAYIMTDPQATTRGAWLYTLHQQITFRGYTDSQATFMLAGLEDKGIIKHVDVSTEDDRLGKRKSTSPAYKITSEGRRFIKQNNERIPSIKSVYKYEIKLYGSKKYNQNFLDHIKDLPFVQGQTSFRIDDDKTLCSIVLFAYRPINREDIEHIASIHKTKIYSFKEET